ncbi:hypothetical protein J8340_22705 [Escherichia coli]|nr:hypothetical protein [Escherichia coli]
MAKLDVKFSGIKKSSLSTVEIGQVRSVNYNIKQQTTAAYIAARKTMKPESALQAARIFALSRFFGVMETLCHDERLDSNEVRIMMQERILHFAEVLEFDENRFEQVRKTKKSQQNNKENKLAERIKVSFKN